MSSTVEIHRDAAPRQAKVDDGDALSTNTTSEAQEVASIKGPASEPMTVAPQTPFDSTSEKTVEELCRRKHMEGAIAAAEAAKKPINWTEDIIVMTPEERNALKYVRFALPRAPVHPAMLSLAFASSGQNWCTCVMPMQSPVQCASLSEETDRCCHPFPPQAGFKELHGEIVDLLCRTPACRDNTEANRDLLIYADPLGESQCSESYPN